MTARWLLLPAVLFIASPAHGIEFDYPTQTFVETTTVTFDSLVPGTILVPGSPVAPGVTFGPPPAPPFDHVSGAAGIRALVVDLGGGNRALETILVEVPPPVGGLAMSWIVFRFDDDLEALGCTATRLLDDVGNLGLRAFNAGVPLYSWGVDAPGPYFAGFKNALSPAIDSVTYGNANLYSQETYRLDDLKLRYTPVIPVPTLGARAWLALGLALGAVVLVASARLARV